MSSVHIKLDNGRVIYAWSIEHHSFSSEQLLAMVERAKEMEAEQNKED